VDAPPFRAFAPAKVAGGACQCLQVAGCRFGPCPGGPAARGGVPAAAAAPRPHQAPGRPSRLQSRRPRPTRRLRPLGGGVGDRTLPVPGPVAACHRHVTPPPSSGNWAWPGCPAASLKPAPVADSRVHYGFITGSARPADAHGGIHANNKYHDNRLGDQWVRSRESACWRRRRYLQERIPTGMSHACLGFGIFL
jgi:hypothetical protein